MYFKPMLCVLLPRRHLIYPTKFDCIVVSLCKMNAHMLASSSTVSGHRPCMHAPMRQAPPCSLRSNSAFLGGYYLHLASRTKKAVLSQMLLRACCPEPIGPMKPALSCPCPHVPADARGSDTCPLPQAPARCSQAEPPSARGQDYRRSPGGRRSWWRPTSSPGLRACSAPMPMLLVRFAAM